MRRRTLRIIFAGAITACSMWRRRRIPTCAGLRIPNGILKHWQFAGLADLAEKLCGPFCHVTTRANLQVREIPPKNAVALIEGIQDLGLCSRGYRRRQHPQRHGHADGRDRSAGAAGYPRICARVALSHPQRPLAVRAAAQVQRRLRRRRQDRGAGRHQRHRVFRGRGEGRFWRRARRLVSPRARRHHRPQGFRQDTATSSSSRRMRPKCRTPSSASSSISATAPTATRRG